MVNLSESGINETNPHLERGILLGLEKRNPNNLLTLRDELGVFTITKYRDKDDNVTYCLIKRDDKVIMVLNGYQHINFYRGIKSRKKGRK